MRCRGGRLCGLRRRRGGCAGAAGLQRAQDFSGQARPVNGFEGVAVHAGGEGVVAVFVQHAGRQRHDAAARLLQRVLLGAQAACGLQAVHARHVQVHQHQVKRCVGTAAQCLFTTAHGSELAGRAGKVHLQQLQVAGHVIHSQDAQPGRQLLQGPCGLGRGFGRAGLAQWQWHMHAEGAALARLAFDLDAPVHQLDQLARNGGAQARAAKAAGGGGIGLRKGVEHVPHLLGAHANAAVLHLQAQPAFVVAHAQQHLAVFGELDGVAQQVHQHLLQAQGITAQIAGLLGRVVQAQRQVFLAGADEQRVQHLLAQAAQREVVHLQRDGAFVQLGLVEDVVEQAQQ